MTGNNNDNNDEEMYRALVIDSGPIITGNMNKFFGKAKWYYTTPTVIQEIRDSKSRQSLLQLSSSFELQIKEPTNESMDDIISFAKQTGDYGSLSIVDIQVLALCLDLEKEGCGNSINHVRSSPKRMIGLGPIQKLAAKEATTTSTESSKDDETKDNKNNEDDSYCSESSSSTSSSNEEADKKKKKEKDLATQQQQETVHNKIQATTTTTWAKLVNPTLASSSSTTTSNNKKPNDKAFILPSFNGSGSGQFDDADSDGNDDEENNNNNKTIETFLPEDDEFPSLAVAAASVPYYDNEEEEEEEKKGSNNVDDDKTNQAEGATAAVAVAQDETNETDATERKKKKEDALKPISNSGKLYNSFRNYGHLMKPSTAATSSNNKTKKKVNKPSTTPLMNIAKDDDEPQDHQRLHDSRILSSTGGGVGGNTTTTGGGAGEMMNAEDDDGEGWITTTSDIQAGRLAPKKKKNSDKNNDDNMVGPPISQRTACTTTDFAMQNVLLQMGLLLLSVDDGRKIRRLQSWVYRCGACFRVHTDSEFVNNKMKRLFCSHCGSDMMQRIAASVDGKTGRLKLHLKKNYKHNLRGTKYSLPKPGSGDRFQGDLLLREDQLLMGVWNQKMKMSTGGKANNVKAQSMFGKDLATNVGCNVVNKGRNKNNLSAATTTTADDIRVGFGRRNPNAVKGRERRGKKKKSSGKACGLRRY